MGTKVARAINSLRATSLCTTLSMPKDEDWDMLGCNLLTTKDTCVQLFTLLCYLSEYGGGEYSLV